MSAGGLTQESIALCLGISIKTLRKYFREELLTAKAKLDAKLSESIINNALAGNTSLLIFLAKTRMGYRDQPHPDKARQMKADADLAELDLAKARGELLRREDVRAAWEAGYMRIRDLLRQVPMALADDLVLAAADGRQAVYSTLHAAIDDALTRASSPAGGALSAPKVIEGQPH